MVNYKERIEKLVQDGKISSAQGAAMQASVTTAGIQGESTSNPHKKLPIALIASGLLLAAVSLYALTGNGTPDTETIQNVSEILNKNGEVGAMNKGITGIIAAIVFIVPVILWFVYIHNDLVNEEENVLGAWAQVESNYQRRADLIPNLVKTVKSFAEHEGKVMSDIAENRPDNSHDIAKAIEELETAERNANALAKDSKDKLGDDNYMQQLALAQKSVGTGVSRLFGLAENYPQLRSADNFLALQDQLEGTENRINIARMVFNDTVRDFNASIRKMPASLVASAGNFRRKAYFQADAGSQSAVKVDFE